MSNGVLFKGNMEEGSYKLIKTTDGWALVGKDIAFVGSDITDRPQGEWIEVDDISISCRCSVCGWEAHLYEDDVYGMPYCPNCGARMKGADDEADNN